MSETKQPFDTFAVVELLGHVRFAGRVTEEQRFGGTVGRCDIPRAPAPDCPECRGTGVMRPSRDPVLMSVNWCRLCAGWTTVYFGAASLFRLTPCGEEEAKAVAFRSQPQPVHPWEMPRGLPAPEPAEYRSGGRNHGDDEDEGDEPEDEGGFRDSGDYEDSEP